MDLEARVKHLEEKVKMLLTMMEAKEDKKLNIDITKFPTKAKSFKIQPISETK